MKSGIVFMWSERDMERSRDYLYNELERKEEGERLVSSPGY